MFKYVFCLLPFMLMAQQNSDLASNPAVIVPIGGIDKAFLENLAEVLEERFNLPSEIKTPLEIPEDAFDSRRGRYNSSKILDKLQPYKDLRFIDYYVILCLEQFVRMRP